MTKSQTIIHRELYHARLNLAAQPWLIAYVATLAAMLGLTTSQALLLGDPCGDNEVSDLITYGVHYYIGAPDSCPVIGG
jgi:hypothetical protein